MILHVTHRTHYVYPTPAMESHNELRLMPLTDEDQTCQFFHLTLRPAAPYFSYRMPWGTVHHFNVRAPHTELDILAEAQVETRRHNPFEGVNLVENDWGFYRRNGVRQEFSEYLAPTQLVPADPAAERIAATARKQAGPSAGSFLIALTRMLNRLMTYSPGATNVRTTLAQILDTQRGVCQDFAHLMLAVCRSQGIPSRYVSGYLYAGRPADPTDRDESGRLRGAQATHAWIECLLPNGVWRGFDPTNNLLSNDHYIKVHWGRDYADVPPTHGVYRGPFALSLNVEVNVTKVEE